jgi:hypothetical protein
MHDRPTTDELLAALERWLRDDVIDQQSGALRYQARVAANILASTRRELQAEDEVLHREWHGLDTLLGRVQRPESRAALSEAIRARTEALCERVRAGDADGGPYRAAAFVHVRNTVRDKLLATNPNWLNEAV